jgi:hypothetical protein
MNQIMLLHIAFVASITVSIPVWCLWTVPCVLLMLWLVWSGANEGGYMGGFAQGIGCLIVLAILVTCWVMYLIFAK